MLRAREPLPDGYQVTEVEGVLRLLDPSGVVLHELPQGPTVSSTLEERAWQDVWERIGRELNNEVRALRDGTVRLRELHRVRQYMRMLDAVNASPQVVQQAPRRSDVVAWLALATSAAAIALIVLTTPFGVPSNPDRSALLTAPLTSAPRSSSERLRARQPVATQTGPVSAPMRVVRETTGYVVGFGEFANHTAAELRMHLVRRKGYLVYVTRVGDSLQVVTRPYRTWAQAERLASALQEIGLPASARIAKLSLLLRGRGDS